MRRTLAFFALALPIVLAGCNADVPMVKVKGRVTLDGVPVETGLVQFVPADGARPSSRGGQIHQGEFTAEVAPGAVIVRINSVKVVGKRKGYTPDSPPMDIHEEIMPAKYHAESILRRDIQPGIGALDFELTSQ